MPLLKPRRGVAYYVCEVDEDSFRLRFIPIFLLKEGRKYYYFGPKGAEEHTSRYEKGRPIGLSTSKAATVKRLLDSARRWTPSGDSDLDEWGTRYIAALEQKLCRMTKRSPSRKPPSTAS